MPDHKLIVDPEVHEPKGASTAAAGEVWISNGAGSGAFAVPPATIDHPTDIRWEDKVVSLTGRVGGGVSNPGFLKVTDNGAGSNGVYAYHFDPASEEELFFDVQLPHSIQAGSEIRPHIHWMTPNANAGNVVWGLEYWVHNFETPADLTTTVLTVTSPAPGVKWQEAIHSFPPIPGTNLKESTVLLCRIFRQAASGSDTYASDAIGLSLDFHCQIEKPGTVAEFPV